LADHVTGVNTAAVYEGSQVATKLKVAGVDVAAMGLQSPECEDDELLEFAEPKRGVYKSVIIRDDRLVGATPVGDNSKALALIKAFEKGLPLPEDRASLLFDLGGPAAEESVADMPDDEQVCNCNGVSKIALKSCVDTGCRTVSGVMDKTRAGKGCGT